MTLNLIKKAIATEIMDYFDKLSEQDELPTRQALSDARNKISYLAFKEFFDESCRLAVGAKEAKTYKDYRLYSCDGTSFFVGDMKYASLREYFDVATTVEGRVMCRIGGIVDVLNDCIVSAMVAPFSRGERSIVIEQIKELCAVKNALFLFDRGYWSPDLIKEILNNKQKFLMRLASNTGNTIVEDELGELHAFRKVFVTLPSGEIETLLTNLSEEEVSDEELAWLYTKRWGVETKYLELKSRLEIGNLSGKTANIVLQDIYSTLYISNLVAFISSETDKIIEERTAGKDNKYDQKAKRSRCISALRSRFVKICLNPNPLARAQLLNQLARDISRDVAYIGKSKSKPRSKRKIKEARLRNPKKSCL
jgi:hypothetical protein